MNTVIFNCGLPRQQPIWPDVLSVSIFNDAPKLDMFDSEGKMQILHQGPRVDKSAAWDKKRTSPGSEEVYHLLMSYKSKQSMPR